MTEYIILKGKCSAFGGPKDHGVTPSEGLAIYEWSDFGQSAGGHKLGPHGLFLLTQPKGTSGLARRLDPTQYYIACRWDYHKTPREFLQKNEVTVIAEKTGKSFHAWPADWGPNEDTGRIADLSYGLLEDLGLTTDDVVTIEIPLPEEK